MDIRRHFASVKEKRRMQAAEVAARKAAAVKPVAPAPVKAPARRKVAPRKRS